VTRLVLGIDEAGRGPALGAMVVAAVALEPAASRRLSRAGVADSKRFGSGVDAHAVRCRFAALIETHAAFFSLEVCEVETIDAYVARGALNVLERERAELLVRAAPPCKRIVADGKHLFGALRQSFPHLEASDRGESKHVAVAAASILAKVRRDDLFARIAARYEPDFGCPIEGGGYVNARTRAFTDWYRTRYGKLPPEARTSWPWRPIGRGGEGGRGQSRTKAPVAPRPVGRQRRSPPLAAGAEER
jgi:ribonuclease HII